LKRLEKGWFTDTKGRKEELEYISDLFLWHNRYLNLAIDTDRGIEEIMKAVKAEILWAKKLKEDVGIATNKDRQKQDSELYDRYLHIPAHFEHPFRSTSNTNSGQSRTPIPVVLEHLPRS
jgi:hypothetical protein